MLIKTSSSNICLDEASLSFPSDDDSYDDHSYIEIVRSKYSTSVDLLLSSSSIPLDKEDDE